MHPYHLQRSEREIKEKQVLKEIIKRCEYTSVAMSEENQPYLVTMNYGFDEAGNCLYFHAANEGHKLDIIKKNPKVMAMIIEDLGYRQGKCDHFYRSVILSGEMALVDTLEEKIHGMEIMLHHLENDPDMVRQQLLSDEKRYNTFTILKLTIDWMMGKENIKG